MSERTALPIGSVVRVREGVEPIMIVNHCPALLPPMGMAVRNLRN